MAYNIAASFAGALTAAVIGPRPAQVYQGNITKDPDEIFDPSDPTGTLSFRIRLPPARWQYVRIQACSVQTCPQARIWTCMCTMGQASALAAVHIYTGLADEEVNLLNPNATSLTVYVHGYARAKCNAGCQAVCVGGASTCTS